eukprot:TRINITY_DN6877_c0_g1_i1.p1 TRINITY_DN6877_c0_g1~~TRINITY_DN6877_c0_g1_i1.p1  ORF type:complete len:214 (+),score=46.04 TRINITY_DN6877_c0_g1_i1:76-717(+)
MGARIVVLSAVAGSLGDAVGVAVTAGAAAPSVTGATSQPCATTGDAAVDCTDVTTAVAASSPSHVTPSSSSSGLVRRRLELSSQSSNESSDCMTSGSGSQAMLRGSGTRSEGLLVLPNNTAKANFTEAAFLEQELKLEEATLRRGSILEDQAGTSVLGLAAVCGMMMLGAWRYKMRRRVAREERLLNAYSTELSAVDGEEAPAEPRLPHDPMY